MFVQPDEDCEAQIQKVRVVLGHTSYMRGWFETLWNVRLLRWRHNGHDSVSNHQPHHCLFNRLFRRRSKKTSKLCVTGLCVGNSPGTGEFPAQMASNAGNVSIWWRHHATFASNDASLGTALRRLDAGVSLISAPISNTCDVKAMLQLT